MSDNNNVSIKTKPDRKLCMACRTGNYRLVDEILSNNEKIDIDFTDDSGGDEYDRTLLWDTCLRGHMRVVISLLAYDSNPNLKYNGQSSLYVALQWNFRGIARLLLKNGADPDSKNNDGMSMLIRSCWLSRYQNVKLLLEHGANPDLEDNYGKTALQYTNDKKIVELLQQYRGLPFSLRSIIISFIDSNPSQKEQIRAIEKKGYASTLLVLIRPNSLPEDIQKSVQYRIYLSQFKKNKRKRK